MYGPISPPTKAMGRIAAMTVEGGENGGIADLIHRFDGHLERRPPLLSGMRQWRTMFSTTTMASSTRMPMEKISANSVMRLSV